MVLKEERELLIVLYLGLAIFGIFLLAKILIPIFTDIVILILLISLVSPFFFLMIVGYIFRTKKRLHLEK